MNIYNLSTKKTWAATYDELTETFRKWGVTTFHVDAMLQGRRAQNLSQTMDERRVTVRWTQRKKEVVLSMNRQDRAVDNFRVLYLAVEALRLNEQRGINDLMAQAYAQLPAVGQSSASTSDDPYIVLGVARTATLEEIEQSWKQLLRHVHPDHGGSEAVTARVNAAMAAIRQERKQ